MSRESTEKFVEKLGEDYVPVSKGTWLKSEIYFDRNDNNYKIQITQEGVVVYGCDCCETMPDSVVVEVYKKLGEYINFKKLK